MILLVLLLFCSCLGCLREGVWTQYTPADVARWQAQSVQETAVVRLAFPPQRPVSPGTSRRYSGPAGRAVGRPKIAATPARKRSARGA